MTPDQYRREGAEAMRKAALYQCVRVPAELPDSPRMAFELGLYSCESAIRAIDVEAVLAKAVAVKSPAPDAVTQPASSCPPPQHGDETYYSKGKTAEWWVGLTDEQFAWELICASQDLNDTGLGDDLDKWMPHQVMLADAAERIKRLSTAAADTEAVARLVDAARAFASWDHCWPGNINLEAACRDIRAALAAMETSHD